MSRRDSPPVRASERPELPVSAADHAFNTDYSGVGVNPKAKPKATLDLDEILSAPPDAQARLLRRYVDNASLRAGLAIGAPQLEQLVDGELTRPGVHLVARGGTLRIELDGETRLIDRKSPRPADARFALRAFDRVLIRAGAVDETAARMFLPLFGPDGAFARGSEPAIPASQRFATPKLLCWDFNGTVERDGDGRTRAGLPASTEALSRRGAKSVLTTTIGPEKPEGFLVEAQVPFVSHYGRAEVRPTKGNKEYRGVAAAHGVTPQSAPRVMAVIGDSLTDIPSDLPGVVFLHNHARTPAPALEHLLSAFDRAGGGSLAAGLEAILGGWPRAGEEKRAVLGPVSFAVEMRDGSNGAAPCVVPTVHGIEVSYDAATLAEALRVRPPPSDLASRALFRLALEHLAERFEPAKVPEVLARLAGTDGLSAAKAALARRESWRGVEAERALAFLDDDAGRFTRSARALDDVVATLQGLVSVEDARVAARLSGLVDELIAAGPAAERDHQASLLAHVEVVKERLSLAERHALPFVPHGASRDPQLLAALQKAAKDPAPLDERSRKQMREALQAVAATPILGSAPLLATLAANLDAAVDKTSELIRARFAERQAKAAELRAIVADAPQRAADAERAWAEIARARAPR